ncbi:MAG: hypothetical protein COY66_02265 [Candidatus Kerfeldbacteria bacterium CG_4_10_14_0_8_um_filter_42_10]|uniref:Uncharacterized protein n=1 Tax=Candidatus Kerfeldbacteria bacterium CG_4_10_14_0_8_um_filter_42_10 TaxID=2014248 RepID=A0A2M7RK62_9BACT|nr:MAG: hypothetical protein COY66_02265 [Candidatus Kerfeldbacteria bacterium CG_4_10_14_0_8_um_filter_42_10]
MAKQNLEEIFQKKKRRLLGEIIKEVELKSAKAWVSIHGSSQEYLLTYESEGLVVSINGSGTIKADHPQAQDAARITEYVVANGGIVMNGGRKSGIMEASSKIGKENSLGIVFPELEKEISKYGPRVVVNAPTPRIELLATCAPIIVIFRGGLGTLMMLMRAITHINNRKYHPEQLPQLVFISNYWIGLLQTLMNMETLPREFLAELEFFSSADEIIKKISKIS